VTTRRYLLVLALWSAPAILHGQTELKDAGVCARCHVVSSLEWGISKHHQVSVNCQSCHGPSRGHVVNERDEVKPDRIPHEAAVAHLCAGCHNAGCPKTAEKANCQKCHHVHALINAAQPSSRQDERLNQLVARWEKFRQRIEEGDRLITLQNWKTARESFLAALEIVPGNHSATARLGFCERRLDPALPGFEIVGTKFDSHTGLPAEVKVAGLDLSMVLIPPGECDIGSDKIPDAQPVHTVEIEAFYLGRFELTQSQWTRIMGNNPSVHKGDNLPVERVSWNDGRELVRRLNERIAGGGFRLPTEAEWEYACRARTQPVSPDQLTRYAWYRANTSIKSAPADSFQQVDAYAPKPVGTREPNPWGLYDMLGNVWEWCSSQARPYVYDAADGRESLTEPGLRILRGGGFADSADFLDPAFRHSERPDRRHQWNGLRLCRDVPRKTR
jgi:formylglycine-generating enzyme required for sulfatase activity